MDATNKTKTPATTTLLATPVGSSPEAVTRQVGRAYKGLVRPRALYLPDPENPIGTAIGGPSCPLALRRKFLSRYLRRLPRKRCLAPPGRGGCREAYAGAPDYRAPRAARYRQDTYTRISNRVVLLVRHFSAARLGARRLGGLAAER